MLPSSGFWGATRADAEAAALAEADGAGAAEADADAEAEESVFGGGALGSSPNGKGKIRMALWSSSAR